MTSQQHQIQAHTCARVCTHTGIHTCTLTRLQVCAAGQLAGIPSPPALHHPLLSPCPDPCPPPTGGRAQSLTLELEGRRGQGLGQLLQAGGWGSILR